MPQFYFNPLNDVFMEALQNLHTQFLNDAVMTRRQNIIHKFISRLKTIERFAVPEEDKIDLLKQAVLDAYYAIRRSSYGSQSLFGKGSRLGVNVRSNTSF